MSLIGQIGQIGPIGLIGQIGLIGDNCRKLKQSTVAAKRKLYFLVATKSPNKGKQWLP